MAGGRVSNDYCKSNFRKEYNSRVCRMQADPKLIEGFNAHNPFYDSSINQTGDFRKHFPDL